MKNQSKASLLGLIVLLTASPFALAETPEPAVPEAAPEVVVTEPVDDNTTDDVSVVPEAAPEVVDTEPADDNTTDDVSVVPTDWVKRGGEDHPEIYQNMVDGGAPVFKPETSSVSKELGQNEKAGNIESKENAGAPVIERVKKGPVALLKKGRVFLR